MTSDQGLFSLVCWPLDPYPLSASTPNPNPGEEGEVSVAKKTIRDSPETNRAQLVSDVSGYFVFEANISLSEQDISQDLSREAECPSTNFKQHLEGRDIF